MKTNGLTLHDVANLKEQIKEEIATILRNKCDDDQWYSARELEELTGGLGSTFHFSNTFASNYDFVNETVHYRTRSKDLSFKMRQRERIRKCAYLNDDGEITGFFEMKDNAILEYRII